MVQLAGAVIRAAYAVKAFKKQALATQRDTLHKNA